jgi:hypothetical protein
VLSNPPYIVIRHRQTQELIYFENVKFLHNYVSAIAANIEQILCKNEKSKLKKMTKEASNLQVPLQ